MSWRNLSILAVVALLSFAVRAKADLITFSDQAGVANDDPAIPSSLFGGSATATYTNFNVWPLNDHTPAPNDDNLTIYGDGTAEIQFSETVVVPSLWVLLSNTGNPNATIDFMLGDTVQHTFSMQDVPAQYTWTETGSSLPVDHIVFTNYLDDHLDDVTVNAVPEPATMSLFGLAGFGLLMRRRRHA